VSTLSPPRDTPQAISDIIFVRFPSPMRLHLLACLFLAGCVHTAYQTDAAAPRLIRVFFGGFFGNESYVADGQYIVEGSYENRGGKYVLRKQTKTSLTPAQWQEFWRAIDAVGVKQWRPRYSAEGMLEVTDSPHWSVEVRRDGQTIRSQGDSAYPRLNDPRQRTQNDAALQHVLSVFHHFASTSPP
jgi:hypothetical protein